MPDEADPPRKFYGFKPREFDRANDAPAQGPVDAPKPDPGIVTAPEGKIDVHDLIRAGAGTGPQLGANAVRNRKNDVHAMLRDNLKKANAAGLNKVDLRKRISRRKRDYLITMLLANAVLIVGAFFQPIFGIAGLILFNLGYTWLTWFVLDDY